MNYCRKYFDELETAAKSLDLSEINGKSIVITGGSGLILSSLVDILCWANINLDTNINIYLAARTENEISERFVEYYGNPWLRYVHYDALKPVDFGFRTDFIIHGASNAHPAAYATEPVETLLANIIGIKELLDYAHECRAKRVLYISSSEVYGKKTMQDLILKMIMDLLIFLTREPAIHREKEHRKLYALLILRNTGLILLLFVPVIFMDLQPQFQTAVQPHSL